MYGYDVYSKYMAIGGAIVEYRMRCKVCGKVWCFTDEDIKENNSNRGMAALSAIGSIASAIGGTTAQQHLNYDMMERTKNKIVDFDQCPNCHSRDVEALSEEKFKELQRREQMSGVQVSVNSNASTESLLTRAELMLEDGDWPSANAYCDHVLDAEPDNARAYMLKLMAELGAHNTRELAEQKKPLEGNTSYERALRFASPELKKELEDYNSAIKERIEQARLAAAYDDALSIYDKVTTETELRALADRFGAIAGFRDADTLRWECSRRADDMRREAERRAAEAAAKAKRNKKLAMIIVPLLAVVIVAGVLISRSAGKSSNYDRAVELMEAGDYSMAEAYFEGLSGYKDSDAMLIEAQKGDAYSRALNSLENGDGDTAYEMFARAGDFEDAADYLADFSRLVVEEIPRYSDNLYYEYDSAGRVTYIRPDRYVSDEPLYVYEYDSEGRVTKETYHEYPSDRVTTYSYDANGNLVKKVALSESSSYMSDSRSEFIYDYSYDSNGYMVSERLTSNTYSTEREDEGELISSTVYDYTYTNDSSGRMIRKDTMGYSKLFTPYYDLYTYNSDGLLESQTRYNGLESEFPSWKEEYSYNAEGNLTTERVTTYHEDGSVKNTSETETEYEYDEQGNILKEGDLDESFNEYIYGYIYTPDKAE